MNEVVIPIYIHIYMDGRWYPAQQSSAVHISGTTGANFFKLSQFKQNKSTTSWEGMVLIGPWEHIFLGM